MRDHAAPGLLDRGRHRVEIERAEHTQVDDLAVDALVCEHAGGLEREVQRRAVGDDRHVAAAPAHGRAGERRRGVVGELALHPRVEALLLEEQHGVGICDRGAEQQPGVLGGGGARDLEPGRAQEPGLGVLRVERAARESSGGRRPDHERDAEAVAEVHLRGGVDDGVHAARQEVAELELDDGPHPVERHADGRAGERCLADRRIDHALLAELLLQPGRRAKRATAAADVLAQHEHAVVVAERRAQSEPDGLDVGDGVAHSANTLAARPPGSG